MAVKVILRQDVPNLGHAGDIKQVAPGYFRNFLLPRGLAVEASKGQVNAVHANKTVREAQSKRRLEQAGALAEHLGNQTVRIPVRLGEQGRIYGSVSNRDIAQALHDQVQITVDRHNIDLREPLKTIGVHSVPVKLEQGVQADIKVELVPEEEAVQS